MFEKLSMAPDDPILGLTEAFKRDPNPAKINLSVGVYKDAQGKTPIFSTVKKAEERLLKSESSKSYLPIDGSPEYANLVQQMVLGEGHEALTSGRAVTAHTPGGTGALRVAGDFIKEMFPGVRVWVSEPTWPNHPGIFRAAGLDVATYPYYDPSTQGLAFDRMIEALSQVPSGDFVLLHACCHNPSGIDPTAEQWRHIADAVTKGGWIPLFDFAYQGLAQGIREDAEGLRTVLATGTEALISSSFSKNFGLYNERVGALTLIGATKESTQRALSHVKRCIRTNYSNPSAHGSSIVTTILSDAALRAEWDGEVCAMRERIHKMRGLFVQSLKSRGVKQDFSFLTRQQGMFSFSGLTKEQVAILREKYAIYIVGSGRINVAGMTEGNMGPLCDAMAETLRA